MSTLQQAPSSSPPPLLQIPTFELYTYFRSSCSARLRIALSLKSLAYTSTPINLLQGAQLSPTHTSLNPSRSVPVLVVRSTTTSAELEGNGEETTFAIPQSLAALEYLEEAPSLLHTRRLLPLSATARATVRTLVGIIACDVQPLTNLRVQKRVRSLNPNDANAATAWAKEFTEAGFDAFEAVLRGLGCAGVYCVGDEVTMADVVLVPAVWAAERVGVDVGRWEVMAGVFGRVSELEEVRGAHWRAQADTPVEFRW
ncbi:maleylacetoacetate isomerase [Polytolypa hystricis UAMH7299]|uniref:Maleylacetoacetate isomerase n=1 Tax=Polytolypa hystricis (strain UAMH7299) TaxID=1447883 RepID=A0A2B7Y8G8_POLH7|nr:maleylacetoacetate isomerase [Polytolypa hystricis UAMH7299]